MIPVEQTHVSRGGGDCLRAALASITELDVPNLIEDVAWWGLYRTWLREHGWTMTDDDGTRPQPGYSVAVGPSPTFVGVNHAAVALDGELVWDPSPHRDDPDRAFRPIQYWRVFRLDSGRIEYDPFAEPPA